MNELDDWSSVSRILCVRLDNLGDVLMSTPAMRALKHRRPDRHITLLASRAGSALAPFLPVVDDTLIYDAAWVKNDSTGYEADRAVIETLRKRDFDAAVIFTVYSQSALPAALMCHLAGIPRVLAHARENPYRLLNPWVRETEPSPQVRHEVQRQLDLVAAVGASTPNLRLVFKTRGVDQESVSLRLRALGLNGRHRVIVAHPGATAESRRYPEAQFAHALSLLARDADAILLTGTRQEMSITAQVASLCAPGTPIMDLGGQLSLGELAALIERAQLLISNNSGPVHIAAAVQTPVVDLYALTNPQHTPWQLRHRLLYHDVPCKYCYRSVCPEGHHRCLTGVEAASVAQAARELLANPSEQPVAAASHEGRACLL